MIEESFLQFLTAQLPLFDSGLGEESIGYYFQNAPQEEKTPYAVFHRTGEDEDYPKNASGLVYCDFDLEVFHTRSDTAAQIADAIKTAINGYQGQMFGYTCTQLRVQVGFDSQEGETNLFYRNLNVQLNYTRI